MNKKVTSKAFVTKTDSTEKVKDAYTRIAQICGDSDHIMCAYSVRVNGGDVSGYVDDGRAWLRCQA